MHAIIFAPAIGLIALTLAYGLVLSFVAGKN